MGEIAGLNPISNDQLFTLIHSNFAFFPTEVKKVSLVTKRVARFFVFCIMIRSKYIYVYLSLAILGAVGGWFYWYNWGCTDACPINSSWKWMSLKGLLIGLSVAAIFQPSRKRQTQGE
jgi:hypothetical protein